MYQPQSIENKWQSFWESHQTFRVDNPVTPEEFKVPKSYILDMFPYPSGAGLHVGHPKGYIATDIIARYKRAKGFRVLHTMGWDAFGLPAENHAIKTGTHPNVTTRLNVENYKRQIQSLGLSYDWDREIDTTDPTYYRWTQWIFSKLFEKGLAYEQDLPINFCPSCKTGLANEEVLANNTCDRCGATVEKKKIRQWVLAITKYADRLLSDIDAVDWPEGIKEMQRNWIGKSEGCQFAFSKSDEVESKLEVYTTRIDTVFGVSYVVVAPDFKGIHTWITPDQKDACETYIRLSASKSDQERTNEGKEKTGVFTGSYVVNPFNNETVPVWIADYVLGSYGTGAVMAVPAHDERDFEFAKKFSLPIRQSIAPLFTDTNGNDAVRSDKETVVRTNVNVVLRDPVHKKIYVLDWEKFGWKSFVIGGVDEGETLENAALREAREETGCQNIRLVQKLGGEIHNHFYAHHKWVNRYARSHGFLLELIDDTFVAPNEEEVVNHRGSWIDESEVSKFINLGNHSLVWKAYLQGDSAFTDDGVLVDSDEFSGLKSADARQKLMEFAQEQGFGWVKVNYKLRDWLFSRQRYWGEPIPLIHLEIEDLKRLPHITSLDQATDKNLAYILKRDPSSGELVNERSLCQWKIRELVIGGRVFSQIYDGLYTKIILDSRLPLLLPDVEKYEPSPEGHSPLANVPDFVNVTLASNLTGKRETNTMPQWAGSCWYYLRFMDPHNTKALVGKEAVSYWGSVDEYVGGAEHAVLHLLYARFWHKVLFDLGVVDFPEPFHRLQNQGMILAYAYEKANGALVAVDLVEEIGGKYIHKETKEELKQIVAKMSKSLKNVVNPNDVCAEYGVDTFRLYEMSIGDFRDAAPWDTRAIIGVRRFLERVCATLIDGEGKKASKDDTAMRLLHKTIKKVGEDIVVYKFNTALSALNILLNEGVPSDPKLASEWSSAFVRILHPFAPHIAEEIWEKFGNTTSISCASWPVFDPAMTVDEEFTIAVQVLGKLRATFTVARTADQAAIITLAKALPELQKWIEGKEIIKEIYVPGKIVNFVLR